MKKIGLFVAALAISISSLLAQSYMVVNSKEIFNSLSDYTKALEEIDKIGKEYQAQVDAKYGEAERIYNNMQQQSNLNATERGVYLSRISTAEEQAQKLQESLFSQNGTFAKKRTEILSPIQRRVFDLIESYAKARNIEMVLDEATSPTVIYHSKEVDHTSAIIEELKKQ